MGLVEESLFIDARPFGTEQARLHLRRICGNDAGEPVVMFHGAIENGRVFYSRSGKGFAPYLAQNGFDVYVPDFRGRGLSGPTIGRRSDHGQNTTITLDIPSIVDFVAGRKGPVPQIWVAHSWGGVLLLSFLARFPEYRPAVRSLVLFGSKRVVQVRNFERLIKIDLIWNGLAQALTAAYGYLPARKWKLGSDDETKLSHLESVAWVKPGPWRDPVDGFDYKAAIKNVDLPPVLFLAGNRDHSLGHPEDVRALIRESGAKDYEYLLLRGFGHIEMLADPRAALEHFPWILNWIRREGRQSQV